MELFNGDCLNILPQLEDNSIDLFFTDLPYGQTACKWDNKIDLEELWNQLNRVCKINCPMIFTTTTKFGVELINSNPKNFRYDLVWVKSTTAGFLNAKKMPMRKHELIYVFYRKLPFYNIADNHTHKFLNSKNGMKGQDNLIYGTEVKQVQNKQYDPPLPTSVIKEENVVVEKDNDYENREIKTRNTIKREENYGKEYLKKKQNFRSYNKKLGAKGEDGHLYDPPLPTSVIKEDDKKIYGCNNEYTYVNPKRNESIYDPPLPNSILEIKSEKGKHQTQKPTALMEWILKYYSKENDIVLDCCMGSGSMGVACKNLNRNFIGIELDDNIFKNAEERLKD